MIFSWIGACVSGAAVTSSKIAPFNNIVTGGNAAKRSPVAPTPMRFAKPPTVAWISFVSNPIAMVVETSVASPTNAASRTMNVKTNNDATVSTALHRVLAIIIEPSTTQVFVSPHSCRTETITPITRATSK